MISDSVLPSKSHLIKICKDTHGLDYTSLGLTGAPCYKDRVILAIFIAEILKSNQKSIDSLPAFKDLLGSRTKLVKELDQLAPTLAFPSTDSKATPRVP